MIKRANNTNRIGTIIGDKDTTTIARVRGKVDDTIELCNDKNHVWKAPSNEIYKLREQGKSEGFDSCDRPSNLTQIQFKSLIFQPMWPWYLMDDPKKQ